MKFKTKFTVPTKDFKDTEQTLLVVTMPDPEELENAKDVEYKVQIPDFMFDELKDTEYQFKTIKASDEPIRTHETGQRSGCFADRDLERKFKKTQTSRSLAVLKDYIFELTDFIIKRHCLETSSIKKKIFIKFNNTSTHTRNNLNGSYRGLEISQRFSYFTGYEVMTNKFSTFHQKVEKAYISKICHATGSTAKLDTGFQEKDDLFLTLADYGESFEAFANRYSIVDWTQEREDFCKKIQDSFIALGEELSKFLKDITNEKFELLMTSNLKMLSA